MQAGLLLMAVLPGDLSGSMLQIVVFRIDNRGIEASGWNVFLRGICLPGLAVML
jgi:hypothetical protein